MHQSVKHFSESGHFQIDVNNQLLLKAGEVVALHAKPYCSVIWIWKEK